MFPDILNLLLNDTCPASLKEWEALVVWACRHELGSLVHYQLESRTDACVPPPAVSARLRYTRYAAQAVSQIREQAWVELLNALAVADISVLVLKGVALSHTVYPDPTLRSMGDIDLLLDPSDLSQTGVVLMGLGFDPKPEPQKRINPFNTSWTGESSYVREYQGIVISVDLHWKLFATEWLSRVMKVDVDAMWKQAVPFPIGQITAHTLASEDMLFHICLHLSLHGFTHLRGYVDILQLLEHDDLDWSLFLERVCAYGLRVACYFPLWWLAQYRAGVIPKEVLAVLKPDPLRAALGKWLVKQGVQREPDSGHTWNHVTQLLIVDRITDYGRLFAWLLFPGRVWLIERYNLQAAWQSWLWMFLHPLIVVWEGVPSFWVLLKQLMSHKH